MSSKHGMRKVTFKLTERTNLNSVLLFLQKMVQELEKQQTVILKSKDRDIEIRPKGEIDFRLKVKDEPKKDRVRQKFTLGMSWEYSPPIIAEEWVLMGQPLTVLPGISFEMIEKLNKIHIQNTAEFYNKARLEEGRENLVVQLECSEDVIENWVNFAEFLRIKELTPEQADVLQKAGIQSVQELAQKTAESAEDEIKKLELKEPAVSLEMLEKWIEQAKKLQETSQE